MEDAPPTQTECFLEARTANAVKADVAVALVVVRIVVAVEVALRTSLLRNTTDESSL